MTVKQVADYFQIDQQSIYKMAKEDKIPSAKIAGQWRFKKSILDEWLTQKINDHESVELSVKSDKEKSGGR